ncbi:hypothetical protein GF345_00165 [Candidatus Woesearchaeota archaeon]|nr:hypothetical protein [Candidatus Woesearchaeota archaeon]
MNLTHIKEGLRIFRHSLYLKLFSHDRYTGDPEEVCRKIVDDCWNNENKYFMTSTGNFAEFWSRDFGMCCEALVNLGYKLEAAETLDYALAVFQKAGRITTTITPSGKPYDFPGFACDSLPFIIRSLKIVKSDKLISRYRKFLVKEVKRYFETAFDPLTGMIRADRSFSSMKDYSKRKSSAYDNCMAAMLKKDLDELGLFNPFRRFDIRKAIKQELWNGKFFYDDLNKLNVVYGDTQVFPFWTGAFNDKRMFESCLKEIRKAKLDRPFPLRYSNQRKVKGQSMVWQEFFVGDYERDTVWMHMGLCYLDCLKRFGRKKELNKHLGQYARQISEHKSFLEVFDSKGEPFRTLFYRCDAGMLWASKFVDLTTR